MAYDDHFLQKMLYFLDHTQRASEHQIVVNKVWNESDIKQYNSIFTGLCPEFCEMVIKKSEFVNTENAILPIYGGQITLDDLCGLIPDPDEQSRYWFMHFEPFSMYRSFRLVDDWVYYEMNQHGTFIASVKLRVKKEYFNKFLTWAFSYLDVDCFNIHIKENSK